MIPFSAPLEVWVGSYRVYVTEVVADKLFPTPSEVWVVSYYRSCCVSIYFK